MRRRLLHAPRILIIALCPVAALLAFGAQAQSNAQLQPPVASRITRPIDESSRLTLKGTVHPLANARNDAGPAAPDLGLTRLQLRLKRSPDQESALHQLIADLHSPGSASYHHWLTPAEFGRQFGPSDQDIQAVEAWVQSHGFQVGALNAGKGTLEISGTAGQLEDTFHTSIHQYMVDGQPHYANANDPQIPAALAPVLGGFVSLNNFPIHRLSHTLGKATYDPRTHQATPQWTVTDGSSPLGYDLVVAPQDYYTQYDLNPLYNAGTKGTGQTIAVINDSNINVAQANNFRTLFGLSANPPQVIIDGNDPGIDGVNNVDGPNYDSTEAYLDVEWSGAVAPGATIDLVIAADTAVEDGVILAAERAVYSDLAPVMSLSFGACEGGLASGNAFLNSLWEQAAAEGITVLVSTGDSGSAGCDRPDENNVTNGTLAEGGLAVNGFASTPYNVAVGGTDFFYYNAHQGGELLTMELDADWRPAPPALSSPTQSTLTQAVAEQPWNDSPFGVNLFSTSTYTIAAGGGGPSTCGNPTLNSAGYVSTCAGYSKPSWQTGAGVPIDGVRDIPDVSLFAADGINDSFLPICASDGDCGSGDNSVQITGVGGTSAAAPAMAGIMALVNQLYGPQGQADFVLYPLAKQVPGAFRDVTQGTNAVPCVIVPISANCTTLGKQFGYGKLEVTGFPAYAATTGYDLATGLGSIDAWVLVSHWIDVTFTAATATLAPSSTSFLHGTAITINTSVTASGGIPTGRVALMTDSLLMSDQAETNFILSNGSAARSINFLPGGTYNIWGQYGGDGTFAADTSNKTRITVSPENSDLLLEIASVGSGGYTAIADGSTIPYGTPILLSGKTLPSTFYTNCVLTNSTSSACTNYSYTTPTGSIAFSDSGKALATAVTNTEGDAQYSTGAYAIGAHSITAGYAGDASYNPSAASAIAFTVAQAPATAITVKVTSNLAYIPQGQTLVLTAIVEAGGSGAPPTGTITFYDSFYDNTHPLGTGTLSAGVDPSTGMAAGIATLTIASDATTAALDSRNIPGFLWAGGGAALAGVLLFGIPKRRRKWQNLLGILVLAVLITGIGCGGSGNSNTNSGGSTGDLSQGSHTITARYGGDANYAAATSIGYVVYVRGIGVKLLASTISAHANTSTTSPSTGILVSVTVTGQTGYPAPTGTVEFLSSGQNLETIPLTASGSGTTATAGVVLNSRILPEGPNLVTLQYSGDFYYQISSLNLPISNPLSDFSMVAQAPTMSINPGSGSPDTINFSPVKGFNSTVALACSAPFGLTCSLSPSSVAVNGNTSAALTVSASPTTLTGNYTVVVTGTPASSTITHNIAIGVAVQ